MRLKIISHSGSFLTFQPPFAADPKFAFKNDMQKSAYSDDYQRKSRTVIAHRSAVRGRLPTLPGYQYHRRGGAYLPCTEWVGVEPPRYDRLTFYSYIALSSNVMLEACRLEAT